VCRFAPCPLLLTAHKLYPVRIRVVNIQGDVVWVTVAYVPLVRKLQEPAADDRARMRRCGVLQRTLYAAFREFIAFSHSGIKVRLGRRIVRAFTRVLLYLADRPEERAVLCLKAGQCELPCSTCTVTHADLGTSLTADDRIVVDSLDNQVEAVEHHRRQRLKRRRVALEAVGSTSSSVPALAGTAGLGTPPRFLYRMIGFDILHVCFLALLSLRLSYGARPLLTRCSLLFRSVRRLLTLDTFLLLLDPWPALVHLQVLDLGVTRMMMHRLIAVFPYMCAPHKPLAVSDAATRRSGNNRFKHMHRRSRASKIAPG